MTDEDSSHHDSAYRLPGAYSIFEEVKVPLADPPYYRDDSSDSGGDSDSSYPDPFSPEGPVIRRPSLHSEVEVSTELVPYVGYGLRVPPGPMHTGLIPLYNAYGTLGYLDPATGYWYYANTSHGYACTPLGEDDNYICGKSPYDGDHQHPTPLACVFLDLRYRIVLRAFAVGRRSGLTVSELNNFAIFAYRRIFKETYSFRPFKKVPEFIHGCCRTGFIFPADRALYHKSEWPDGMMRHPIVLGRGLMEFITHVECVHFGQIDRFHDHFFGGEVRLWCPEIRGTRFPDRYRQYTAQTSQGNYSSWLLLSHWHVVLSHVLCLQWQMRCWHSLPVWSSSNTSVQKLVGMGIVNLHILGQRCSGCPRSLCLVKCLLVFGGRLPMFWNRDYVVPSLRTGLPEGGQCVSIIIFPYMTGYSSFMFYSVLTKARASWCC